MATQDVALPHIQHNEKSINVVVDRIWRGVCLVWRNEKNIRDGRYDARRLECEANTIMNRVDEYHGSGQHLELADYLNTQRTWLTNYHLTELTNQDIDRAVYALRRVERNEAFAMGHHHRLGNMSRVLSVDEGIIRMILDQA